MLLTTNVRPSGPTAKSNPSGFEELLRSKLAVNTCVGGAPAPEVSVSSDIKDSPPSVVSLWNPVGDFVTSLVGEPPSQETTPSPALSVRPALSLSVASLCAIEMAGLATATPPPILPPVFLDPPGSLDAPSSFPGLRPAIVSLCSCAGDAIAPVIGEARSRATVPLPAPLVGPVFALSAAPPDAPGDASPTTEPPPALSLVFVGPPGFLDAAPPL
mmetsp:Transcript_92842/g.267063  ORF Transcript_92842/g.267063 Transcript_92842/m.267063 type:complete len:215 (+) Transcript_92842:287-931(+)